MKNEGLVYCQGYTNTKFDVLAGFLNPINHAVGIRDDSERIIWWKSFTPASNTQTHTACPQCQFAWAVELFVLPKVPHVTSEMLLEALVGEGSLDDKIDSLLKRAELDIQ